MDSLQGRTLSERYQIAELIGRGGTPDTYRAVDLTLHRDVALKVLIERSESTNARLLLEARAMARLNHPRIVSIYDVGEDQSISFIVMELIHGKTLAACQSGELQYKQALSYIHEVLEALDYANAQGVIHRDIKPSNVMTVESGRHVKLTDFGLARRATEVTQTTRAGQIVGTISYLAPERFMSKPADARSDLYSVGILMYEIFTGTLPFKTDRDDIVATMYSHVHDLPTPPREINRSIPESLENVMLRAIEKDPGRRYQTAGEFLADIGNLLGASPTLKTFATSAKSSSDSGLRSVIDRTLAPARNRNEALENILKGMIATRHRDYDEAKDCYLMAMHELAAANNDVEYSKTALKFGGMILQKCADGHRDREELLDAVNRLNEALRIFREFGLNEQHAQSEYTINALERTAIGIAF